jgi:hypothetical protein
MLSIFMALPGVVVVEAVTISMSAHFPCFVADPALRLFDHLDKSQTAI